MAKKSIVWSETAAKQRRGIFQYWNKRNSSTNYSNKIRLLVNEQVQLISKNPSSFLLTDYNENLVTVIEHFCIYFKIIQHQILITAFWDSRQDPQKLLETL